jgi:6-phosphogluconolactonase (cycloisomerase 2 family)
MAVSPDHRFLYAALRSPPFAASSFGIDPSSGRLSHLAVTSATNTGRVSLRPAQVSMLLEGIDWRMPRRVRPPELAG